MDLDVILLRTYLTGVIIQYSKTTEDKNGASSKVEKIGPVFEREIPTMFKNEFNMKKSRF